MNRFDQLGARIAREQDSLLERHNAQAEVRARLAELDLETLQGSARSATRRLRRAAWLGGVAAITAAAAVALLMWGGERRISPALLTVVLADEPAHNATTHQTAQATAPKTSLQVGHFVQAPRDHAVALQFSDGSRVQLAKSGRGRLMGLRSRAGRCPSMCSITRIPRGISEQARSWSTSRVPTSMWAGSPRPIPWS
jgi:hypothetical protein